MAESESTKGIPRRLARRRPTVDLPAPIRPTRTIGRSRRSVRFPPSGAIQRPAAPDKAVSFQQTDASVMPRAIILLIVVLLLIVGLMFFFSSRADEVP